MEPSDPIVSRRREGFAVAALVLGEGAVPIAQGLAQRAPIAAALDAARGLDRAQRRAFLRAVLRAHASVAQPALPAASRAAARARALLEPGELEAPRARRAFAPDPQLVAWLGRVWARALRAEGR